jgi:hypothetical protein
MQPYKLDEGVIKLAQIVSIRARSVSQIPDPLERFPVQAGTQTENLHTLLFGQNRTRQRAFSSWWQLTVFFAISLKPVRNAVVFTEQGLLSASTVEKRN